MSSRRLQSCIVMALLTTSASAFANGTGSGVLPGPDRSFAIDMDLTNDAASTSDVVSIILDGSTNDAFPILWCTIGSVFSPPGATTTAGGVGTQTVTFNFMDAPDGFNPGETLSLVGIDPDGDPGPVGVSIGEMIGVEVTFVYEDGCVYRGVFVDDPRPGAGLVLARVPIGKSYCGPGVPNSTGLPGSLACNGSDIAADEDVTLVASDLPPGNVCLFLASVNQGLIQPPRSCGPICLMGPDIARFKFDAQVVDSAGMCSLQLDPFVVMTNPPQPILAGQAWNFQAWHRDAGAGPDCNNNFTNACEITFQ